MRNPLSIEAFADWCEKQPAYRLYNYSNCRHCAFAQYLEHLGFRGASVDGSSFSLTGKFEDDRPLSAVIDRAVYEEPNTFGALASRLRAAS